MALFLDRRLLPNGNSSQINNDNSINLDNYIQTIVDNSINAIPTPALTPTIESVSFATKTGGGSASATVTGTVTNILGVTIALKNTLTPGLIYPLGSSNITGVQGYVDSATGTVIVITPAGATFDGWTVVATVIYN